MKITLRNRKIIVILLNIFFLQACDSSSGVAEGKLFFSDVSIMAGLDYKLGEQEIFLYDRDTGGVAVDDVDDDGYLDFFVTHGRSGKGRMFLNQRDGTFKDATNESMIETSMRPRGAAFIDVTGDGKNDLLVSEAPPVHLSVFKKNEDNTFTDITDITTLKPKGNPISIAAGDFDKDGDLDVGIALYGERAVPGNFTDWLWENKNGIFEDVTSQLAIPPQIFGVEVSEDMQANAVVSFADMNDDSYLDLVFVANFQNGQIYLNNHNGQFEPVESQIFDDEAGMGSSIGDFDNDGDFDWFVTSIYDKDKLSESGIYQGTTGNRLYRNDGQGIFIDVTEEAGVRNGYFGWASCFADFDNDGDLDIFHVNGYGDKDSSQGLIYSQYIYDPVVFYMNNGNGKFEEKAIALGLLETGQGRGVSCWDYDNDGDLDILIGNNGASPVLYRNDLESQNGYIDIRLVGLTGNKQGIGAKIYLKQQGALQVREIRSGSNYLSNNPLIAHFGLGLNKTTSDIVVHWNDADENITRLTNVEVNRLITISHPSLGNN